MQIDYRFNHQRRHWTATSAARPDLRGRGLKLGQARLQVLRRLSLPHNAPGLSETVHLPDDIQAAYEQHLIDLEQLKTLEAAVRAARVALVKRFTALQMTVKDAARLLRLSPQHLANLASPVSHEPLTGCSDPRHELPASYSASPAT